MYVHERSSSPPSPDLWTGALCNISIYPHRPSLCILSDLPGHRALKGAATQQLFDAHTHTSADVHDLHTLLSHPVGRYLGVKLYNNSFLRSYCDVQE